MCFLLLTEKYIIFPTTEFILILRNLTGTQNKASKGKKKAQPISCAFHIYSVSFIRCGKNIDSYISEAPSVTVGFCVHIKVYRSTSGPIDKCTRILGS